jgi:hypothetical protein
MADELLKFLGPWVLIFLVAGAAVDCFQFFWIVKRGYVRWKKALYRKVRQELLYEQHEGKK